MLSAQDEQYRLLQTLSANFDIASDYASRVTKSEKKNKAASEYFAEAGRFLHSAARVEHKAVVGARLNEIHDQCTADMSFSSEYPLISRALLYAAASNDAAKSENAIEELVCYWLNCLVERADELDSKSLKRDKLDAAGTALQIAADFLSADLRHTERKLFDGAEALLRLKNNAETYHAYRVFIRLGDNLIEELETEKDKKPHVKAAWHKFKASELYQQMLLRLNADSEFAILVESLASGAAYMSGEKRRRNAAESGLDHKATSLISATAEVAETHRPALTGAYSVVSATAHAIRLRPQMLAIALSPSSTSPAESAEGSLSLSTPARRSKRIRMMSEKSPEPASPLEDDSLSDSGKERSPFVRNSRQSAIRAAERLNKKLAMFSIKPDDAAAAFALFAPTAESTKQKFHAIGGASTSVSTKPIVSLPVAKLMQAALAKETTEATLAGAAARKALRHWSQAQWVRPEMSQSTPVASALMASSSAMPSAAVGTGESQWFEAVQKPARWFRSGVEVPSSAKLPMVRPNYSAELRSELGGEVEVPAPFTVAPQESSSSGYPTVAATSTPYDVPGLEPAPAYSQVVPTAVAPAFAGIWPQYMPIPQIVPTAAAPTFTGIWSQYMTAPQVVPTVVEPALAGIWSQCMTATQDVPTAAAPTFAGIWQQYMPIPQVVPTAAAPTFTGTWPQFLFAPQMVPTVPGLMAGAPIQLPQQDDLDASIGTSV